MSLHGLGDEQSLQLKIQSRSRKKHKTKVPNTHLKLSDPSVVALIGWLCSLLSLCLPHLQQQANEGAPRSHLLSFLSMWKRKTLPISCPYIAAGISGCSPQSTIDLKGWETENILSDCKYKGIKCVFRGLAVSLQVKIFLNLHLCLFSLSIKFGHAL